MGIPTGYHGHESVAIFITPEGNFEVTYSPSPRDTGELIKGKRTIGYQLVAAFDLVNEKFYLKAEDFTKNHKPNPNARIELSDIMGTVH